MILFYRIYMAVVIALAIFFFGAAVAVLFEMNETLFDRIVYSGMFINFGLVFSSCGFFVWLSKNET